MGKSGSTNRCGGKCYVFEDSESPAAADTPPLGIVWLDRHVDKTIPNKHCCIVTVLRGCIPARIVGIAIGPMGKSGSANRRGGQRYFIVFQIPSPTADTAPLGIVGLNRNGNTIGGRWDNAPNGRLVPPGVNVVDGIERPHNIVTIVVSTTAKIDVVVALVVTAIDGENKATGSTHPINDRAGSGEFFHQHRIPIVSIR